MSGFFHGKNRGFGFKNLDGKIERHDDLDCYLLTCLLSLAARAQTKGEAQQHEWQR